MTLTASIPTASTPPRSSLVGPRGNSHAIASAAIWAAAICLTAAALGTLSLLLDQGIPNLWWAIGCLAVIAAFLVTAFHARRSPKIVYPLMVGAILALGLYSSIYMHEVSFLSNTNSFSLSIPRIALILAAGIVPSPRTGMIAAVLAYIAGNVVTVIASDATSFIFLLDPTSTALCVMVIGILFVRMISMHGLAKHRPEMFDAASEAQIADLRARLELSTRAMLHDVVLSQLAALAISPSGPLSPQLRASLERDLNTYAEGTLLSLTPSEGTTIDHATTGATTRAAGSLLAVVDEARGRGLSVTVQGDVTSVAALDDDVASEMALAVGQCLANVLKHSGTSAADVMVTRSATQALVMVVDEGRGFDVDAQNGGLGLRTSVRHRIGQLGGTVKIWSTPGAGTSVMLQVPLRESTPESDSTAVTDAAGTA